MKGVETVQMFHWGRVSIIIASKPFVCFTGNAFTLSVSQANKARLRRVSRQKIFTWGMNRLFFLCSTNSSMFSFNSNFYHCFQFRES